MYEFVWGSVELAGEQADAVLERTNWWIANRLNNRRRKVCREHFLPLVLILQTADAVQAPDWNHLFAAIFPEAFNPGLFSPRCPNEEEEEEDALPHPMQGGDSDATMSIESDRFPEVHSHFSLHSR